MTTTQHITAEKLLELSSKQRCELVKGELRMMSPAGFDHGAVIMNLAVPMALHVRKHGLGLVLGAETGFRLKHNPDTVRAADVAFVSSSRLPNGPRPVGYWEGAPDLAVEVVSPTDTVDETEEKVDEYLQAGTRAVWIVNPKRKTVTIHKTGVNPVVLREGGLLMSEDILPGFNCKVGEIFA